MPKGDSKGELVKYGNAARISTTRAQDDVSITGRLISVMGLNPDSTVEELWQDVVVEIGRASVYAARAGAHLIRIKSALPHGAFLPELERMGFDTSQAQGCMKIARFIGSLPEDQATKLLSQSKHKVLALARAEPEVVEQLFEDGVFDGDEALSVRELRQRLKKAEQRAIDADTDKKTAQGERDRALQQMGAVSPSIDKAFAALRDQAVYLLERMAHENTLLGEIVEDKLILKDWRGRPDQRDRQAVAAVLYHALNGVVANSMHLLSALDSTFGAFITGGMRPDLQYTPDEREQLLLLRESALSAADKDFRSTEVDTRKKHKTRGRHS